MCFLKYLNFSLLDPLHNEMLSSLPLINIYHGNHNFHQGNSPERVWVGNDGFNDVVRVMWIISPRIAQLTHAGCRELPLTALQTPREEAEELASGGLFFTTKRMHAK